MDFSDSLAQPFILELRQEQLSDIIIETRSRS